jgi:hypothetical protein
MLFTRELPATAEISPSIAGAFSVGLAILYFLTKELPSSLTHSGLNHFCTIRERLRARQRTSAVLRHKAASDVACSHVAALRGVKARASASHVAFLLGYVHIIS